MKKMLKMFGAASLLGALLIFSGCGDDDATTSTNTTTAATTTSTAAPTTTTTAAPTTTTTTVATTTTTTVAGPITLSATTTTGTATAGADVFRLAAATTSYSVTISGGFLWSADKIAVPTGSTNPSALAGGVNNVTDGAVALTWISGGNTVTINLTGLDATSEAALQSNAGNVTSVVYTTY